MEEMSRAAAASTGGFRPRARAWWGSLEELQGIGVRAQVWVFALVVLLLWTRRVGVFLHPQFYAEDGAVWYAEAYNLGWLRSLTLPEGGYLNTLPRLVTGVALLLPFRVAPLLMNAVGMAIQVLPVTALLSRRCRTWGPLQLRVVMAALYVLLPNAKEIHVMLTNAQWHLALVAVLIAFGAPPESWREGLGDAVLFGVGAVSGPFGILLLPPVMIYWWLRRQGWTLAVAAVLAVGAAVQIFFLMTVVRTPPKPLGATPMLLMRLLGGHVFINAMAGGNPITPYFPAPIILAMVVFGVFVIGFGCRYGPLPLRLLVLFGFTVLAAGLHSPLTAGDTPAWVLMLRSSNGRYWFYPMLAYVWCGVWCVARGRSRPVQYAGRALLGTMIFGIVATWVYKPWPDYEFQASAARFEEAPSGERMVIKIVPEGQGMVLVKK